MPERDFAADVADTEVWVRRGAHRIYARTTGPARRDGDGAGPPLVLLHGFPDNLHLYDRLLPYLRPARQVVTFDFLGWESPTSPPATPTPQPTRPATWTPPSTSGSTPGRWAGSSATTTSGPSWSPPSTSSSARHARPSGDSTTTCSARSGRDAGWCRSCAASQRRSGSCSA